MAVDPAPFSSTKSREVVTSARIVAILEIAEAQDREAPFYNLDIPTPQHYLYLTKLFPLCRLEADVDEHGNVIEIAMTDSRAYPVSTVIIVNPAPQPGRRWGEEETTSAISVRTNSRKRP
jgi:hypothetical protein